jgi:hypothetical protein
MKEAGQFLLNDVPAAARNGEYLSSKFTFRITMVGLNPEITRVTE